MQIMLDDQDRKALAIKEIDEAAIERQLDFFKKGAPKIELIRPATTGDGIKILDESHSPNLKEVHGKAAAEGRLMKFVPASGAATRMFADLTKYLLENPDGSLAEDPSDKTGREVCSFFKSLKRFAFFPRLAELMRRDGLDLDTELGSDRPKNILDYTLGEKGLNYAQLPKALILFHSYDGHVRTSLEEHLVEAVHYTLDGNGRSRVHFTVSPEHLTPVERKIAAVIDRYQEKYHVQYNVPLSLQSPSTDTIAVDLENRPFRDSMGRLLLRPAGHGAILENLDHCMGDVVLIRNIDNVVPDRFKEANVRYTILLSGYLLALQEKTFGYLKALSRHNVGNDALREIRDFAKNELKITVENGFERFDSGRQVHLLFERLNRPIRVCGMVKNEGEPGGGPFWVREKDGTESLQIVETAQVDLQDSSQKRIVEGATHFNPVDIVCGLRDYEGKSFALRNFRDDEAVFISGKSHEGKPIKALELPGLWNGSMARWLTIFVEVPIETFNPVKTVNDLLRPRHQQL